MTDKLMPTDHDGDRLPSGFAGESDAGLGLAGLGGLTGAGPTGRFAPAPEKSRVSGQIILAAVVLVLAGGAIYGMRFVGLNAGFGDEGVKIDYTSQTGTPEAARRFDRVMTELDSSLGAVQIANTDEIPQTPFSRPETAESGPIVFEEPNDMDDLDRLARMAAEQQRLEQEERMALIQGELARMEVQSIIGGRVPAARVSGQTITIGQTIGIFRVLDIAGGSVFIESDGHKYELRIGLPPRHVE